MNIKDAFESWKSEIKPHVIAQYGADDECALSESWNDYTDSLNKDGDLSDLQYQYCPAWDDAMPDDDKEFILDAMGVSFGSVKLAARPDNLADWSADATHWKVIIKRAKNEFAIFYSMGSAHTGAPDDMDVFNCLLTDTSDIDGVEFEDWASDLGYDPDSRKAERAFKACQGTMMNLRAMFSESELSDLRELFQDY